MIHNILWDDREWMTGDSDLAVAAVFWKKKPPAKTEILQRQLTANPADNSIASAVISRDGKYLAYSDKNGISIQEIQNGDTHSVRGTVGLVIQDWYPDALHLLVTDDRNNLWTLFAFSGEKQKLAEQVFHAVMAADGSQILLFRKSVPNELWTMPSDGGEPKLWFALENGGLVIDAAWSPDGKAIADLQDSGHALLGTLEIRNIQEGNTKVLVADRSLVCGGSGAVRWLADGRILFSRCGDNNDSDLWVLSSGSNGSAAREPVRLTNTTGSYISGLSASVDGKRLAVTFSREAYSAIVAGLDRTGSKLEPPLRLTNDSWINEPKAWTADGQTLFYVSTSYKTSIYKRNMTADSAELFAGGAEDYCCASVTPDGDWLLASLSTGSDTQRLLRIPISGGPPEPVLTMAGPGYVRCASSGARICILGEEIGKQEVFSIVDPVRGRLEELEKIDAPVSFGGGWDLSPEGRKIALAEWNGDRVNILDLQSKQLLVIHPIPPERDLQHVAWSADGKRLFVSGFPDEKGRLLEMDADGHTHLLLENPNGWIGSPVPSPDGKRIAYTSVTRESNVSLLEHF